jgi:hypothetical protein
MACPDVDPELRMMALTSRTSGGMRTSDLHAFDWAMVDTVNWFDAEVPRPKTHSKTRLALPDVLLPALKAWHESQGSPASGAVFPARRGNRAGQHKIGKQSYAEKLRNALWAAGIVRPMPGYDPEHPDRTLCLIQSGSTERRPLDFHSFRRAYNTALATAGVNVQVSMKLAGHRNASTHMRYVLLAETLTTPAAALPQLIGTKSNGDALPALPPSTVNIAPAEEIPADLRTVQAARMPELSPANDTDKKSGINSAPPTGVEPVTFGLGIVLKRVHRVAVTMH